ncbi:emp24/gp25L/p24 family/GOLD-domain-containing protein [Mortierella sp. GBAus27b]|nr:emp24/gp25L/p24 family/GOLD-domain-containing protein [Mortierella sp. GBAus27b]
MTRKLFSATVAISLLILATTWIQATSAVKFDLAGQEPDEVLPVCISHYVDAETKVVIKVKAGPGANQKVSVEVTDDSMHQNQLWRKDGLTDEIQRGAFLTKEASDVVACFTNTLAKGYTPDSRYSRAIDVEFEIGSETIDYVKLAETEKLKPMEVELRKLEDLVRDILGNMEHLKDREEKMRNTNGKSQEPKNLQVNLSHTEMLYCTLSRVSRMHLTPQLTYLCYLVFWTNLFFRIDQRTCQVVLYSDNVRVGRVGIVADLLLEALLPQEETYRLRPSNVGVVFIASNPLCQTETHGETRRQ